MQPVRVERSKYLDSDNIHYQQQLPTWTEVCLHITCFAYCMCVCICLCAACVLRVLYASRCMCCVVRVVCCMLCVVCRVLRVLLVLLVLGEVLHVACCVACCVSRVALRVLCDAWEVFLMRFAVFNACERVNLCVVVVSQNLSQILHLLNSPRRLEQPKTSQDYHSLKSIKHRISQIRRILFET